jgi:hypothetical protein
VDQATLTSSENLLNDEESEDEDAHQSTTAKSDDGHDNPPHPSINPINPYDEHFYNIDDNLLYTCEDDYNDGMQLVRGKPYYP